jgi:hypothetical protein
MMKLPGFSQTLKVLHLQKLLLKSEAVNVIQGTRKATTDLDQ